jgi:DNA-binding PadR family transcriptional regulator
MQCIASTPQISRHVLRLFALMSADPLARWWGVQLSRELEVPSGTIYPLLARLETAGWLESAWEEIDPTEQGRPRRRLYRLTGEGERVANEALAEFGALPRRARSRRALRSKLGKPQWI